MPSAPQNRNAKLMSVIVPRDSIGAVDDAANRLGVERRARSTTCSMTNSRAAPSPRK